MRRGGKGFRHPRAGLDSGAPAALLLPRTFIGLLSRRPLRIRRFETADADVGQQVLRGLKLAQNEKVKDICGTAKEAAEKIKHRDSSGTKVPSE